MTTTGTRTRKPALKVVTDAQAPSTTHATKMTDASKDLADALNAKPATTTRAKAQTAKPGSQAPAQGVVSAFARYAGVLDGVSCQETTCKNSHITKDAATKCLASRARKAGDGEHTTGIVEVERYAVTRNGAPCSHKFSHRTREAAEQCAGIRRIAPAAADPKPAAKPAARKTPLRSGSSGVTGRA